MPPGESKREKAGKLELPSCFSVVFLPLFHSQSIRRKDNTTVRSLTSRSMSSSRSLRFLEIVAGITGLGF